MKVIDNHKISYFLVSFDTLFVGVAGFEPATSASQTRRDNRATLHPDIGYLNISIFIQFNAAAPKLHGNLQPPRTPDYFGTAR